MDFDELAQRHDLLDVLETEPLVDYLHHHGVLSKSVAHSVLGAHSQRQRNASLLEEIARCASESHDAHGDDAECSPGGPDILSTSCFDCFAVDSSNSRSISMDESHAPNDCFQALLPCVQRKRHMQPTIRSPSTQCHLVRAMRRACLSTHCATPGTTF